MSPRWRDSLVSMCQRKSVSLCQFRWSRHKVNEEIFWAQWSSWWCTWSWHQRARRPSPMIFGLCAHHKKYFEQASNPVPTKQCYKKPRQVLFQYIFISFAIVTSLFLDMCSFSLEYFHLLRKTDFFLTNMCSFSFSSIWFTFGTLPKKNRENVGILKKKTGGVYPNPTSFVIWPSGFWHAKFILSC